MTGESLFTGAQKTLFEEMVNSNVNFNDWRLIMQYWCETTYFEESKYDLTTRGIPDNNWDRLYRDILKDFSESAKIISTTQYGDPTPAYKKNRLLIVDIMTVYAYSVLVETFGNVPYSQALNINIPLPKYDDGLAIYKELINRLSSDINNLDASAGSLGDADNMYHGDVASWIKFANSLKLRMGMLLSDIPTEAAFAKATVEAAAAASIISSNSENARIIYLASQPNTNPIYVDLVASGRNDFVATNVFVDTLNALNDPRRPFYFTLHDTSSTDIPKLAYVGGVSGTGNDFTKFSHVADQIQLPNFEGLIFDYAEVEFLLAEGIERGYSITGSAEEHYKNAIRASMEYWGVKDADITTYIESPKVAYSTAAGNYKQKIGTQQWLAYYNRGFEAWTEWRKMDFPKLVAPVDAVSVFPVRFTYPIEEQTLNGANYKSASAALGVGGDDVGTKLFFDKY